MTKLRVKCFFVWARPWTTIIQILIAYQSFSFTGQTAWLDKENARNYKILSGREQKVFISLSLSWKGLVFYHPSDFVLENTLCRKTNLDSYYFVFT
jgi:hypothetical protein